MARATPDFFSAQRAARLRTALLLAWFGLALLVLVVLFYVGAAIPLFVTREKGLLFHAELLGFVAVGVLGTTTAGCVLQMVRLARGGPAAVVEGVGATRIEPGTADLAERRLVNVVEEMAIASGVPVPQAYVLRDEPSINALAAGQATRGAVVAVTGGALDHLTRDELQAVIAHEFGHLLNGDSLLHERLMGLVSGLTVLDLFGREALDLALAAGRRDWRIGVVALPSGLVLAAAGWAGLLCGQVVRCAVSRQREYLADAEAAQFTRNPAALASALARIREQGSALQRARAVEASHFFFANALEGLFARWLQTHPPIEERIRRLDPARADALRAGASSGRVASSPAQASAAGGGRPATAAPASAAGAPAYGKAGPEHLTRAAEILQSLPPLIVSAAHGADAPALLLALASVDAHATPPTPPDPGGSTVGGRAAALLPSVRALPPAERLCAVDLALASLDRVAPVELEALQRAIDEATRADGRLTVFEWMLASLVRRGVERRRVGGRPPPPRFFAVAQLEVECLHLLSAIAWSGAGDAERAGAALAAGVAAVDAHARWSLLPREKLGPAVVDAALRAVGRGSPAVKQRVLRACVATAFVDGRVTAPEAELLRVVAASLDCPAPPVLPGALSPDSLDSDACRSATTT